MGCKRFRTNTSIHREVIHYLHNVLRDEYELVRPDEIQTVLQLERLARCEAHTATQVINRWINTQNNASGTSIKYRRVPLPKTSGQHIIGPTVNSKHTGANTPVSAQREAIKQRAVTSAVMTHKLPVAGPCSCTILRMSVCPLAGSAAAGG